MSSKKKKGSTSKRKQARKPEVNPLSQDTELSAILDDLLTLEEEAPSTTKPKRFPNIKSAKNYLLKAEEEFLAKQPINNPKTTKSAPLPDLDTYLDNLAQGENLDDPYYTDISKLNASIFDSVTTKEAAFLDEMLAGVVKGKYKDAISLKSTSLSSAFPEHHSPTTVLKTTSMESGYESTGDLFKTLSGKSSALGANTCLPNVDPSKGLKTIHELVDLLESSNKPVGKTKPKRQTKPKKKIISTDDLFKTLSGQSSALDADSSSPNVDNSKDSTTIHDLVDLGASSNKPVEKTKPKRQIKPKKIIKSTSDLNDPDYTDISKLKASNFDSATTQETAFLNTMLDEVVKGKYREENSLKSTSRSSVLSEHQYSKTILKTTSVKSGYESTDDLFKTLSGQSSALDADSSSLNVDPSKGLKTIHDLVDLLESSNKPVEKTTRKRKIQSKNTAVSIPQTAHELSSNLNSSNVSSSTIDLSNQSSSNRYSLRYASSNSSATVGNGQNLIARTPKKFEAFSWIVDPSKRNLPVQKTTDLMVDSNTSMKDLKQVEKNLPNLPPHKIEPIAITQSDEKTFDNFIVGTPKGDASATLVAYPWSLDPSKRNLPVRKPTDLMVDSNRSMEDKKQVEKTLPKLLPLKRKPTAIIGNGQKTIDKFFFGAPKGTKPFVLPPVALPWSLDPSNLPAEKDIKQVEQIEPVESRKSTLPPRMKTTTIIGNGQTIIEKFTVNTPKDDVPTPFEAFPKTFNPFKPSLPAQKTAKLVFSNKQMADIKQVKEIEPKSALPSQKLNTTIMGNGRNFFAGIPKGDAPTHFEASSRSFDPSKRDLPVQKTTDLVVDANKPIEDQQQVEQIEPVGLIQARLPPQKKKPRGRPRSKK